MGDDADDHLLLKENQDVFPRFKLNNYFGLLLSFLRGHLSFLAVGVCLAGTLLANNSLGKSDFGESGFLFGYLEGKGGGEGQIVEILSEDSKNVRKDYSIAQLPNVDPTLGIGGGENTLGEDSELENDNPDIPAEKIEYSSLASLQGNSLLVSTAFYSEGEDDLRYGVAKYLVKSGDTPSSIAYSFGVSTNTVLWANNLNYGSYIKPNQELIIPPVTGVLHEIKETDTMEKIAEKYKTDAELAIFFNALPADGNLENKIGKTIIIPNGSLAEPSRPAEVITNRRTVTSSSNYRYVPATSRKGHRFPWGYCTWYVATKRHVPWGGHAKSWLANARSYGYRVDNTPSVGAIMVTTEHRYYGHVTYVEAIHGNMITISEMNYVGFGVKSVRTISANSRVIRGFIH